MLIESTSFNEAGIAARHFEDGVFRDCEFKSLSFEGGNIEAVFINCSFVDVEWYWGLFNCCVLVSCRFERCSFRGTSFADCKIVESSFTNCRFLPDNLGRPCTAPGTHWYACSAEANDGWESLLDSSR